MNGYFRVPRSLTRSRLWEDANPMHKMMFITILDHVLFTHAKFDDHGVILDLRPGQFCASHEEIAKLCGEKFKKIDVQRGLTRFEKYGFLRQEVIHRKTVITITHPETYDLICKANDAISDPDLMQKRYEKDSQKEKEMNENNKIYKSAQTATPPRNDQIIFSFERRRFENVLAEDIQDWKKIYPAANLEVEMVRMVDWCLSNPVQAKSKKKWRAFISSWLSKSNENTINKEAKFQNRSKPSVVNRDTTDSSVGKTFDFSEDV